MKALIVETAMCTPHFETSIEIGYKHKIAGDDVVYAPIFHLVRDSFWVSNIKGENDRPITDSSKEWLSYGKELIESNFEFDIIDEARALNILQQIDSHGTYENLRVNGIDINYNGIPLRGIVESNIIQRHASVDVESLYKKYPEEFPILASNVIFAYHAGLELIKKHKPDFVILFNGRTNSSYGVYAACKACNVVAILHERGSSIGKYSLQEMSTMYIDYFITEIKKYSMGRKKYSARLSAASYYHRQKYGKLKSFFAYNKQNHTEEISIQGLEDNFVCFFASSNDEILYAPDQDLSIGLGNQYQVVEALAKICQSLNTQLVLRLHPRSTPYEHEKYKNILSDFSSALIIPPESSVSSYILAAMSTHNFSYGSTLTFELHFSGINCALLGKSAAHRSGNVKELHSEGEIFDYLKNKVNYVDNEFAIQFGDFMNNFGEDFDFYKPSTLFSGTFEANLQRANFLGYKI